jgi:adenylylsulfate kinase
MKDSYARNKEPVTIWITGISAAGKTTLGTRLYEDLLADGIDNLTFLDGEDVRKSLKKNYGHSIEDRFALLQDVRELIRGIKAQGRHVIIATISHKRKMRETARAELSPFMEVWLKCPVEICHQRDYKGNYDKALSGEIYPFVGVTEAYEESDHPDLVLHTGDLSIDEAAAGLLAAARKFIGAKTTVGRKR